MAVTRSTARHRSTRRRPVRVAGMERGTALLAAVSCLVFATGTALLTRSPGTTAFATIAIALGLTLTLRILRTTT